ncbi:short-subunit dehydrogenase [Allofrancisella inopinata]|uniref:SDR family NAD(P)-dependent oxidoreductase n=1 Tax=Allofrancisella inopinata TaxID=1085647 RepID=A0AAE7CS95_9GAMM|nr:SDR family NAD(P)-dependent oxidoreductase [Allofrancisella inopinata]QIV96513.1 SDR family NAD(P)-dependent oxidoreductase [Allofrancisella inopinata]TDT68492.1 short-subunit dehydrogenase [Allofrancisella inopinata]
MNVLIVGASRGLGKQLAINFAKQNTSLILIARNEDNLKTTQNLCEKAGADGVEYFVCDTGNIDKFIKTLQEITSRYVIDLCIYAAGITSVISNNQFEDLQHSNNLLKINLNGAIAATNYLLPQMLESNTGHIVYFSSLASYYGMAYSPVYCASKAGLRVYAESVRQYCHKTNVNISVITMGFVESDMSRQFTRPKPFLLSTEKAATYICKRINKRKAYIRFPLILQLAIRLQSILPYKLADWFMIKTGYGRK